MHSVQRIAVDIGNSGLRVVPLPDDSITALSEPLRINWSSGLGAEPRIRESYFPDDTAWTRLLLPFVQKGEEVQWWISSVNRPATSVLVEFLGRWPTCQIKLVDHGWIPLLVRVDFPDQVGIDRLLASLAASQVTSQRPLVVIQAGSAVTVDLVERKPADDGQPNQDCFMGGAILPGVPMVLRLLGKAADLLPVMDAGELVDLPPLPGRNTEAAMLAGVSSSLVGGAQHLVERYRQQFGNQIPVVISGGDGPLLAPHLPQPVIEVPQLVLQGIRFVSKSESDTWKK